MRNRRESKERKVKEKGEEVRLWERGGRGDATRDRKRGGSERVTKGNL